MAPRFLWRLLVGLGAYNTSHTFLDQVSQMKQHAKKANTGSTSPTPSLFVAI